MEVRDVELALRKKIYEIGNNFDRSEKKYNLSDLYIAKYSYDIDCGYFSDPELGDPAFAAIDTYKTTRIGILTKEDDETYRDLIELLGYDLFEYPEHYVIKANDIEQIRRFDVPRMVSLDDIVGLYKYLEDSYGLRGIDKSLSNNEESSFIVTQGRNR